MTGYIKEATGTYLPQNQILCGESTALLTAFPDRSIDLVLTDPPYLINYRDRDGRTVKNDDNPEAVLSVYKELYRVLKPDSYCISFYGWSTIEAFSKVWKEVGFNIAGHFVWHKPYNSRAGHVRYCHEAAYLLVKGNPVRPKQPLNDVLEWEYTGNKSHPTEKAVSILSPLINTYSNAGDVILDPFSGSGSTSVAAMLNNRNYIGIELEQGYCELAQRRIAGARRYINSLAA